MFTGYWHNIDHILSDTNIEGNSSEDTVFIIRQDKHIRSYIYSLPRVSSCDTESHPYFKVIGQTKSGSLNMLFLAGLHMSRQQIAT